MDTFEIIETERQRRHLTHTELADQIGMSRQLWQQIRKGRVQIRPKHLDMLADALGLTDEGRGTLHTVAARAEGYRI